MKDIKDNEHLVGVDDWDFIFDWVQEQRPATVARLIRQIEYENTIIKGGWRESWRESRLKSGTGEPMSRDSPEVSRTLDSGPANPVALDQLLVASCCPHGHGHSASLCGACGQDDCASEARAEKAEAELAIAFDCGIKEHCGLSVGCIRHLTKNWEATKQRELDLKDRAEKAEAELAEVLVKEAQARFEWGTWEARAEKAETELATTKQCDCSYHNEIHFTARKEANPR